MQDDAPDNIHLANQQETLSTAANSKLTVDRIKKVAALGFEASKISNIIARFSTENQVYLPYPAETCAILSKFGEKYPFLSQYHPDGSLQATIICDLVISLAHNYDIAFNMFSVLTKMWSTDTIDYGSSHPVIGYFMFLENLVETIRNSSASLVGGLAISIQYLLSDSIMTTNTTALLANLKREETLRKLNETAATEYSTLDKLQTFVANFNELHRSPKTVKLFQRVVKFVMNVLKMLQFSNSDQCEISPADVLQLDLQAIVGTLVFEHGIYPVDLEPLTCSFYMNLVHAIALNLSSPVLQVKHEIDSNGIEIMLQNMENQNEEDVRESAAIEGKAVCQNAVVFDYLSKHNPVLGYLLQNLLNERVGIQRVEFFGCEENFVEHMLRVDQVRVLSQMFDRSIVRAALSFDSISVGSVANYLTKTHDFQ